MLRGEDTAERFCLPGIRKTREVKSSPHHGVRILLRKTRRIYEKVKQLYRALLVWLCVCRCKHGHCHCVRYVISEDQDVYKRQVLDNVKIGLHNQMPYSTLTGILRLPKYRKVEAEMCIRDRYYRSDDL